jgi:hypothetical protein
VTGHEHRINSRHVAGLRTGPGSPLNLGEWRGHRLDRLGRQVSLTGDPELVRPYDELLGYPAPMAPGKPDGAAIMVELRLAAAGGGGELTFFSTVTAFGTAVDVTVAELSIEAFFPADSEAAARLRP